MPRVKEKVSPLKLLFRGLWINEEFVNLDNYSEYEPSEYIKKLTKSVSNNDTINLKEDVVEKVNGIKAPNKGAKNIKKAEQVINKDNELSR